MYNYIGMKKYLEVEDKVKIVNNINQIDLFNIQEPFSPNVKKKYQGQIMTVKKLSDFHLWMEEDSGKSMWNYSEIERRISSKQKEKINVQVLDEIIGIKELAEEIKRLVSSVNSKTNGSIEEMCRGRMPLFDDMKVIEGCVEKENDLYKDGKRIGICRDEIGAFYESTDDNDDIFLESVYIKTSVPGTFYQLYFVDIE